MKRNVFAIALLLFFSASSWAQEFEEGDIVLNLGIGFGSTLYSGSFYSTSIPPISASVEYGIMDGVLDEGSIGVGGYLGFSQYKWDYNVFGADWGYKYTNFVIGARGVFHYPVLDQLDTYTGILLGFNVVSVDEYGSEVFGYSYSTSGSGIVGSWFVGGRYYFSDNLAAMLELGYGITYFNFGVALKF